MKRDFSFKAAPGFKSTANLHASKYAYNVSYYVDHYNRYDQPNWSTSYWYSCWQSGTEDVFSYTEKYNVWTYNENKFYAVYAGSYYPYQSQVTMPYYYTFRYTVSHYRTDSKDHYNTNPTYSCSLESNTYVSSYSRYDQPVYGAIYTRYIS